MIIGDFDHMNRLGGFPVQFDDQSPLFIQSHPVLALAVILQFFEAKRISGPKCSLVAG
jgi:hypothetical protein